MEDEEKLRIQIEVLKELEYTTVWTFENNEPMMKTVVMFHEVIKSMNERRAAIHASHVIQALINAFT